jgi:dGTP triphosphohydrolase
MAVKGSDISEQAKAAKATLEKITAYAGVLKDQYEDQDRSLLDINNKIDKPVKTTKSLLHKVQHQDAFQTPNVATALSDVKQVVEKLLEALKRKPSLDQVLSVGDELDQASINLRAQLPGDISEALNNTMKGGWQANAAIGGKAPDGAVRTKAVGNSAENGFQGNAPVYGDLASRISELYPASK